MLSYILILASVILKSSTFLKHRDLVACVVAYISCWTTWCDSPKAHDKATLSMHRCLTAVCSVLLWFECKLNYEPESVTSPVSGQTTEQ